MSTNPAQIYQQAMREYFSKRPTQEEFDEALKNQTYEGDSSISQPIYLNQGEGIESISYQDKFPQNSQTENFKNLKDNLRLPSSLREKFSVKDENLITFIVVIIITFIVMYAMIKYEISKMENDILKTICNRSGL